MYIIFDTETTTFPNPHLPLNHARQARIVQLAAVLTDENFKELGHMNHVIKPDGWTIQQGAFEAHGISMKACEEFGIPVKDALKDFFALATQSLISIAYNGSFDNTLLEIELSHYEPNEQAKLFGVETQGWLRKRTCFCPMEAMTPICKLPFKVLKKNNFGQKYKWPKLQEAYTYIFKKPFEGAHDALSDVRATLEIYQWLVTRKEGELVI